jgi:hypothetical protein
MGPTTIASNCVGLETRKTEHDGLKVRKMKGGEVRASTWIGCAQKELDESWHYMWEK